MCFGEKTGRSAFIAIKGTEVERLYENPPTYENPGGFSFVPVEHPWAQMTRREFIKAFSANCGLDPDDMTGFLCELETINGVVAVVRGSQLIVSYYGPDGTSIIPLFYFKILPMRSDVFVLPLTVRHYLEKSRFPVSAATSLLESFIRFADMDMLNPSPADGRVSVLYLRPDALFDGVGELVTQIKRFSCTVSA